MAGDLHLPRELPRRMLQLRPAGTHIVELPRPTTTTPWTAAIIVLTVLNSTRSQGAFLIPYFICLVVEGIPIIHLELAIGQRLRQGSVGVWNAIHPLLGGLGVTSMLISFLVGVYYNAILAWILWYFFNSFEEPLPWKNCPLNEQGDDYLPECLRSHPVDHFWYRETLNVTGTLEESGGIQWWLGLCLMAAWAAVYLCTLRGIESTGKAVYVTATFPYVILLCFLVRGLTLEGATDGLAYLFTPKLEVLKNPRVWLDASTQIFYSLGLGFGGMMAFSSYNPIENDCERDAVTIACINSATSLFASIPIFSILGFKATTAFTGCLDGNILKLTNEFDLAEGNVTRDSYHVALASLNSTWPQRVHSLGILTCNLQQNLNQAASGTGLVFIVFTEAILNMPGSQVWSVLFFVMLFMLGLSSMFGHIESILTPLLDLHVFPARFPNEAISGLICGVSLLISLLFTLGSGSYWLIVFDSYVGSLPLLFTVMIELLAVIYVYGYHRFSSDLEFMTGRRPNLYWRVMWCVISPLLLVIIFIAYVAMQSSTPFTYETWNPDYDKFPEKQVRPYPSWMAAVVVLLAGVPCLSLPLVALYRLAQGGWPPQTPPLPPPGGLKMGDPAHIGGPSTRL